ncbi:MAG: aspartate 1-decarboxylase [bacterium]
MFKSMLKSKIHRAVVTDASLHYEGSITIDEEYMEKADILPYEQVHIYNVTNGNRFTTYAIPGRRGSKTFCVNGAAVHKANKGDVIIIATYALYSEEELKNGHKPKTIYMDENNQEIIK